MAQTIFTGVNSLPFIPKVESIFHAVNFSVWALELARLREVQSTLPTLTSALTFTTIFQLHGINHAIARTL